jgi:O-antigen/teichoic acid export membrane protein
MSAAEAVDNAKENPLKKRYFAKLSANLIGLVISLVTQSLVLRSLKPKAYGDFSYLTNVSTQIVSFFDMGTSLAFYTKLSQRQKEFGLVSFYFGFSILLSALILLLVALSHIVSVDSVLWPGQSIVFVYLAVIWAILNWITQTINNMGDAHGLTLSIEKMRVVQKVLGLLLIVALFFYKQLDLYRFFLYNFAVSGFLIGAIVLILAKAGHLQRTDWRLSRIEIRSYAKEFNRYSRPLFFYFLVSSVVVAFERWLLQIFSGSVQQGFFGLSAQIGAFCFIFTSSIASLIIREFSIAYSRNDLQQMGYLFRRYIPLFYGIAAFFACFIAMQADSVARIFGGDKFQGAGPVIALMAFYQIHQTYGMLSGSIFMATGQTGLLSKISILTSLAGIPLAYLLMAPAAKMGLHAGAVGLAVKMLVAQVVGVNVQLYFNSLFLKLNFWRYVAHQILSVTVLLAISAFAMLVVNNVLAPQYNLVTRFLLSGVLYTAVVFGALYVMPVLFGLGRKDLSLAGLGFAKLGMRTG